VVLDTTVLNVALPTLVRGLTASSTDLQWIVDAYVVVFAGLIDLAGEQSGAGDETRTRDIQLGRKDATARAARVFRKALDASMAHFLWLANVLF
jgi:hypothetical protein